MFTRLKSVACLVVAAAAIATPAAGQNARTDGRWQAWIGCWRPAISLIRVIGNGASSVVCVVPSTTVSSVDLITVSDGKIVDRTHVDTDGQPQAISKEGCTGSQSAKWSAKSGERVYLTSEFNCSGAPVTHVTALYAMAGAGEWIDVQGMRVGKNVGVHAVRYREVTDPGSLPAEISQKLRGRSLAKRAAMLAATEPPSLADVAEASREIDPSVVATWLIEVDKLTIERPKPLDAKQLVELADNGVPGSVIDVMVGLSYPNVLTVNPVSRGVARQNADSDYAQYGIIAAMPTPDPMIGFDRFGYPIYASEASPFACSPYAYSPYYSSWDLYSSQLNCASYGYGYNGYPSYGYGGYPYYGGYGIYGGYLGGGYFGGGPVVVPRPHGSTGAAGPPAHGHVVNGRGYSAGSSGSGGTTTATPVTAGTSSAGASSPPPPPPRTAQPRKP